jgi:hypothetical protein
MFNGTTIKIMCLVGLGFLVGMSGCGKADLPNRKPVVFVRGAFFCNDNPATGAIVTFWPLDDPDPRALPSQGRVATDGAFAMTTYVTADGVPKGNYTVTIYWPDSSQKPRSEDGESELPPDLLKGRFAMKKTSVLRASVGNKPITFEPVDVAANDVAQSHEYFLRER